MNLPKLAIERPVFVTCLIVLLMVMGLMAYRSLGVDLFPDVNFPVVVVNTPYRGAGPEEIETLVSKPIEEELSTLQGLKKVSSINQEGFSIVWAEFTLETSSKDAEQRVRDKVAYVRPRLPKDVDEPILRRFDPADQPIATLSLKADLSPSQLYDLADELVKAKLAQVKDVGLVEIFGGTKREIRVELDRAKLNAYQLGASTVAQKIAANSQNVPVGNVERADGRNLLFRTVGEYQDLERIKKTVVNFAGSDVAVPVERLGTVVDGLEEAKTYGYLNGEPALLVNVYKQSGSNSVAVVEGVTARMEKINKELKSLPGAPELRMVRDTAKWVRMDLEDVQHSILLGVLLTVLVVLLFLGSVRSTLITITALPVSMMGAFLLMGAMGYTLNVMTLLALSLAVGLLIDDAIVVRENIYRHIEMGEDPKKAALEGTLEVALAVVATTAVVISVFMPIAFLKGTVGQFFRQFGMTVCFAMAVSLFESMTMGPMLSAYWAKKGEGERKKDGGFLNGILNWFDSFQTWMEGRYERTIRWVLSHRAAVIGMATAVFLGSLFLFTVVKKTFVPNTDNGEFQVALKAAPGTSLKTMADWTLKVDALIRKHPEVDLVSATAGSGTEFNVANLVVEMKPVDERELSVAQIKEMLRKELEPFRETLQPSVGDVQAVGNEAPFNLILAGEDYATLAPLSKEIMEKFRSIPGLVDVGSNFEGGKPEFQVRLDPLRMQALGVSGVEAGMELRTQVEGDVPAKFREGGREYDIRVRMREDQRDLRQAYAAVRVPNQNRNMVRLADISTPLEVEGPSKINRQNRQRFVMITGQLGPEGALGGITEEAKKILAGANIPAGVHYEFVGQAEDMMEMMVSMFMAIGLAALFTYMVLASLYESPVTPITIMTAIPLAMVGALVALVVSGQTLDIFSMIAVVMLMGLVTKNSILVVDLTLQLQHQGMQREEALVKAGVTRLRPILMTTLALIAGMLPLALALTEVGKFRQSMGVAVLGGLISSMFLTLLVVPAVYGIVDNVRLWFRKVFRLDGEEAPALETEGLPKARAESPRPGRGRTALERWMRGN